jgi:hypothetical protein
VLGAHLTFFFGTAVCPNQALKNLLRGNSIGQAGLRIPSAEDRSTMGSLEPLIFSTQAFKRHDASFRTMNYTAYPFLK